MQSVEIMNSMQESTFVDMMEASPRTAREALFARFGVKAKKGGLVSAASKKRPAVRQRGCAGPPRKRRNDERLVHDDLYRP